MARGGGGGGGRPGGRGAAGVEVPQVQFFDNVETHDVVANNPGTMPHLVPALSWWPRVHADISKIGQFDVKAKTELEHNLETIASCECWPTPPWLDSSAFERSKEAVERIPTF